ncbi:olfactomedin-4-like [Erpetoichthys calabaricus]|uniref:Olfactomedin 4 n=1 Tax=Erpetoichthys calabaricus TaxID=27687 RepID=A0A8C4TBD5_ERPCA|nr:olfactomedin-4-like [Erpetoichthys calabaricus]
MFSLAVLVILGLSTASQSLEEHLTGHENGTIDANGVCQCSVFLPDPTFPVDRMEKVEMTSNSLSILVEQELLKIQESMTKISIFEKRMHNLTIRIEKMESSGITYTELDFELLKLEIREMEMLITQLKGSFSGSNVIVDQLYAEIKNMSLTITSLETLDKNNVLAIRREILSLKKKLQDCEEYKNHTNPGPTQPPVIYGSCNHGLILDISQPFVAQLNWRGFEYKSGAWGKDPEPEPPKKELYWQAPLNTDNRYMEYYRYYLSYDNFLLYKYPSQNRVVYGQGSGMVVFKNHLYYNCHSSRDICKLNLDSNNVVLRKTIPNAVYENRFSYTTPWQDIDIAVDESGLWVIYATEQSTGNIVISKLNETSLEVQRTWTTKQYKPSVSNAFIVCGVLYATRTVNTRQEEIFYAYDTNTEQESKISLSFNKMMESIYGVNYNPKDHKLYVYNDGYLVNYDLSFNPNPEATKGV